MADNRVLNYSEFAGKYQKNAEQDAATSYSEFSKASDNFQEGFDDDTYEDGQSGPQRPINGGGETTPDAPDSQPVPTEGMEAPSDEAEETQEHEEEEEEHDGIEAEEVEDDDDDEEFEEGDPEAGEDEDEEEDEEEDTNESVRIRKNNFILESFDEFEARGPIPSQPRSKPHSGGYEDVLNTIELDFDDNHQEYEDEEDNGECFVTCKSCGAKKEVEQGAYPMGAENEANPDSWWQGASMGMQCGCK
jgi:hypothetical protein